MTDSLAPSLVIGTVVDIDDPAQQGRLRVQRMDQPDGVETDWMPVVRPFAGADHGSLLTAEVGDVAVVAFAGRRPFVMGFIYAGGMTVPTDAPEEKIIKAKDGSLIKLIDGDDKGITLADGNGNEIVMNKDGVSLKSSGDIKIEAGGTATVIGTTVELNP